MVGLGSRKFTSVTQLKPSAFQIILLLLGKTNKDACFGASVPKSEPVRSHVLQNIHFAESKVQISKHYRFAAAISSSEKSSKSAMLFLTVVCIQEGHARSVDKKFTSLGRINCPLRPETTWFTIAAVTSSGSRTGSLKSSFATNGSIIGVRIQIGFTTLIV